MSIVVTGDWARIIEQSEIQCLESRLKAIQEMEGNPMGIEMKKFGNAMAFSAKNIPGPSFNKVLGVSEDEMGDIDSIVGFYEKKDIPVRFDITPAHASTDLLRTLFEKGLFQSGFHNTLCGSLSSDLIFKNELNTLIDVREFKQDEFDIFGDIYTRGFNMPSFLKEHVARNNKILHHKENWRFYMAIYDDKPVGVGVLFKYNDIGTLAASATIPDFRNMGVHRALIAKRLEEARQFHCNWIVGQAEFGSVSQRNMERAAMQSVYTKGIWTLA